MTKYIRERLLEEAKKHAYLNDFIYCVGWQDWMEEYISDLEYSHIYGLKDQDNKKIDEVLENIFNEVHKK